MNYQAAVAAQSNEAQQPPVSFLSLPAEIRLKIYTFALSVSSHHILSMQALSTGEASPKSVRCFMPHCTGHRQHLYCFDTREPVTLSLLRTCRLVYHEASLMPYSGNTFKFYQDPQAYRMFMENRSLLQLQEIRSLEILSEGPRFGEKKRNDIWLNMCTTMESMTSLKHLKLALRMVCIYVFEGPVCHKFVLRSSYWWSKSATYAYQPHPVGPVRSFGCQCLAMAHTSLRPSHIPLLIFR